MTYSERGGAQDGYCENIFPRDNGEVDREPSQPLPFGTGARYLVRACNGWFGLVMAGVRVALHLAPVEGEHFGLLEWNYLILSVEGSILGVFSRGCMPCLPSRLSRLRGLNKRATPRGWL